VIVFGTNFLKKRTLLKECTVERRYSCTNGRSGDHSGVVQEKRVFCLFLPLIWDD